MRKICLTVLLIFCSAVIVVAAGHAAAQQAGYIFDVQGTAQLKSAEGKTITLKRSEHLLYAVKDGDRIKVEKGRVVVASLKESRGYEVGDKSEGVVRLGKVVAVKGKVSELQGLHAPGKTAAGSMGGFVVRSVKPCIRAISPVSTTIMDLTPQLSWENKCSGDKKVTVKIISGDTVLFSAESADNSLKVPARVLAYGNEYRWIVDSGKVNNVSGGIFSLPSQAEADEIAKRWALVKRIAEGVPQRAIAAELGLSLCKITRGSRELKKESSSFRRMLEIAGYSVVEKKRRGQ